ncbi:MAG: 6-phosphogluconolactonase [Armatimonadetes bacterium]|nr:6-phosphogluconolactonase [Armatimonadota bacterium]MDE2205159.1 6-phosphogluconolactonase [Armatimonadota bacterium]
MKRVVVSPTLQEVADSAVELVAELAAEAIAARGSFRLALSGGNAPRAMYRTLARPEVASQIDWSRTHIFVSDERCVPISQPESNWGAAAALFVNSLQVPPENLHPAWVPQQSPEQLAARYEREIGEEFGLPPGPAPSFDLIFLGLGDDGHTASLFPGNPSLNVTDRWVVASAPGTLPPPVDRITFTYPLINAATCVVLLVTGAAKARIVNQVVNGPCNPELHPACGVMPQAGDLVWLVDEAASAAFRTH